MHSMTNSLIVKKEFLKAYTFVALLNHSST